MLKCADLQFRKKGQNLFKVQFLNTLTCHIYGTENVLKRVEVKLRYWSDLVARVACNVSLRFRNHQLGILNGLILQGLKKSWKIDQHWTRKIDNDFWREVPKVNKSETLTDSVAWSTFGYHNFQSKFKPHEEQLRNKSSLSNRKGLSLAFYQEEESSSRDFQTYPPTKWESCPRYHWRWPWFPLFFLHFLRVSMSSSSFSLCFTFSQFLPRVTCFYEVETGQLLDFWRHKEFLLYWEFKWVSFLCKTAKS